MSNYFFLFQSASHFQVPAFRIGGERPLEHGFLKKGKCYSFSFCNELTEVHLVTSTVDFFFSKMKSVIKCFYMNSDASIWSVCFKSQLLLVFISIKFGDKA